MKNTFLYEFTSLSILLVSVISGQETGSYDKIIKDGTGPVFIVEPPSKVDFSFSSTRLVLDCLVHGDPEPKVTWHKNDGEEILNESTISGGLLVRILNNNSLELSVSRFSQERSTFDVSQSSVFNCKASNTFGAIISRPVHLNTVIDSQVYSTQVYDEYVITGNIAKLTCHFPSYISDYVRVTSWIRDDNIRILPDNYNHGDKYIIDREGNLYVLNLDQGDSGSVYKCETRHKLGGKSEVTSDKAAGRLHVTSPSSSIPPTIVHTKQELDINKGEHLLIPCVAHGHPPPVYSWCFRNHQSESCDQIESSDRFQSVGSLLVLNVNKDDGGFYVCKASNDMGQAQAVTKLTVFSLMSAFIHPQVQIAEIGKPAAIRCIVSGGPIKTVKWFKDGRMVSKVSSAIADSSFVYNVSKTTKSSRGMYQCFVENGREVKQASGQLILSAVPPEFIEVFKKKVKQPGEQVQLECLATGEPLPTIKWVFNGLPLKSDGKKTVASSSAMGKTSSSLQIKNVETSSGGIYGCIASNKVGQISHFRRLDVYGAPHVSPIENQTIAANQEATLNCYFSGYPITSINWYKDQKLLTDNNRLKLYKNGSLVIKSTTPENQGQYSCEVSNNRGVNSRSSGMLNIIETPVLNKFPAKRVLESGRRLHIGCPLQAGDPPVHFTWLFNGKKPPHELEIVTADSVFLSTLNVARVNINHSGNYSCVAKNMAGTDVQTMAVLVKSPPKWRRKPSSQKVYLHQSITLPCSGVGYPKPSTKWELLKDNKELVIGHQTNKKIHENGSLSIHSIQKEDLMYKYICSVYNTIEPKLISEVLLTLKRNTIVFDKSFPNNIQVKAGQSAKLGCQARGMGPFTVHWMNGSIQISPKSQNRVAQTKKEQPGLITSYFEIKRPRLSDTGLYTCRVSSKDTLNSTSIFLNVINYGRKTESTFSEDLTDSGKSESFETETINHAQNRTSSFLDLSGVTLLYIIPTTTAAVVLFIILIIVCVLLCGQKRKRDRTPSLRESMPSSTLTRKVDSNFEENLSTLPRSNDRYNHLKSDDRRSSDGNFYDPMSTYPRTSSQIQPYATFTSDGKPPLVNSLTLESKRFE